MRLKGQLSGARHVNDSRKKKGSSLAVYVGRADVEMREDFFDFF